MMGFKVCEVVGTGRKVGSGGQDVSVEVREKKTLIRKEQLSTTIEN